MLLFVVLLAVLQLPDARTVASSPPPRALVSIAAAGQEKVDLPAEVKADATLLDLEWAAVKQVWTGFAVQKDGAVVPTAGKGAQSPVQAWDVGKGMADLLSNELARVAPAIRVERKAAEQAEEKARAVADNAGASQGDPLPAAASPSLPRFLLAGSLLRFGGEAMLPGQSGAEGAAAAVDVFRSILSMMRDRGHVALAIRIVDPCNGEILSSVKVETQSERRGRLLGGLKSKKDAPAGAAIDMTSPEFQNTILGEATMLAVKEAARRLGDGLQALCRDQK